MADELNDLMVHYLISVGPRITIDSDGSLCADGWEAEHWESHIADGATPLEAARALAKKLEEGK